MFDLLGNIVDTIGILVDMIVSFFKNVVEVISLVATAIGEAAIVISVMPLQYRLLLLAFISFSVIITFVHFGG